MRLSELKVIVTGAASGMGRHFALELCRAGAAVAAGDVNEEGLAAMADEAKSGGAASGGSREARVITGKLNVADEASVDAFIKMTREKLGGLNALVNNAGILRDGLL